MAKIAKTYQDQLKRLKECVESSRKYFEDNYKRYHYFRNFTYNTSISDDDSSVLTYLKKPQIECNTSEAFISRLLGEFAKQEPSIAVGSAFGQPVDPKLIDFLEGHFKWLLYQANQDSFEYEVYKEALSGGFSEMEAWTEYEGERSFNQIIRIGKNSDPTMVGFDALARKPHKGDGRYWFKIYPKTEREFSEEYDDVDLKGIDFSRNIEGFNWSYVNDNEKILLICEFFEKKKRRAKIVQTSDGRSMTQDDYDKFTNEWNEAVQKGLTVQQVPAIVKSRQTLITTICRYVFVENQVIEYSETDYSALNGVFVDGNSAYIQKGGSNSNTQMTRPYLYHIMGTQKLKNYAMQSLGNELENMVQHKWIVAKEAIPVDYKNAYTDNQVPNVLIYNFYKDNDPNKQLPLPQPVVRPPIPQEIIGTFQLCDQAMQMSLGTYDSAQGITNTEISGRAIEIGALQTNAASMPYIVGYLQALNQLAQIVLDLIPKYYRTPRSLPIIDKQGQRAWVQVNAPGGLNLNYDSTQLQIRVEAGVNFAVQKSQDLQKIIALSQAIPAVGSFINAMGLDVILDNFDINGIDELRERAKVWMAQMQKQQQQAASQPNPIAMKMQVEQQKNQNQAMQIQNDAAFRAQEIQNDRDSVANDTLEIMLEAEQANRKDVVELAKARAEDERSKADMTVATHDQILKHHDQLHQQGMDIANLVHDVTSKHRELDLKEQAVKQPTGESVNV